VKVDTYLIKMFGLKSATAIKLESQKKRDLVKTILLKEINRTYKYSEAVKIKINVSVGILSIGL